MSRNNAALAEALYTHMGENNVDGMEPYLHPEVQFITPLANLTGKDAYLEATRNFTKSFSSLKIRTVMGSDNQAIVVYDLDFPMLPEKIPSVSLLTFREGLITKIELFYDARPFVKR